MTRSLAAAAPVVSMVSRLEEEIAPLAEPLRDWVRQKKWEALRPIQKEAIAALLSEPFGETDVVLAASTASGKTEAALLPLLTRIYQRHEQPRRSFEILYLSPLKALINDMAGRVSDLAGRANRRAYRRHGDVSGPERLGSSGVLLTTPESLEAQFLRSPETLAFVFADLQAVIVDEIHAYFDSPRGPQVISLLTRLEALLAEERKRPESRIPRVALSATVGARGDDAEAMVREFLRPERPERVRILCPAAVENAARFHLKVFQRPAEEDEGSPLGAPRREPFAGHSQRGLDEWPEPAPAMREISRDLYEVFSQCEKGLIFTNSRREAEELADLLNRQAREQGLVEQPGKPGELDHDFVSGTRRFWPHHGSLDASMRSRAEKVMRDKEERSILVCTTTLELGIDIGTVEATAQIGPGFSVASLRQRLGRSGRRGNMQPTLHSYVRESAPGKDADPVERLHLRTFRTLAQVSLLLRGEFEPPDQRLNLSTLIQQLLSCVRQRQDDDGLDLQTARELLVERGPFGSAREVLDPLILHLQRKYRPLLEEQNGRLFLTEEGKRYVENFTFYAAFLTPQEYTVRAGARRLGSFAPRYPYGPGDQFLFGGAYWEVLRVDHTRHVLEVTRAAGGRVPYFEGDALAPSHPVVQEMWRLYRSAAAPELPPDTNREARRIVVDGRAAYREICAQGARIVRYGSRGTMLFPWVGTRRQITLVSALKWMGLPAAAMDVAVLVRDAELEEIEQTLRRFLAEDPPDEHDLARYGSRLAFEKHDYLLSPALKRLNFASARLDVPSLRSTIEGLLERAAGPMPSPSERP